MIEITKHVYVETKYLGANVGCVLTEQGPVLIDTPVVPDEARDWRGQIERLTNLDIAYLITTDHHFDHAVGSSFLTRKLICHEIAFRGIEYLQTPANLETQFMQFFPELYKEKKEIFHSIEIVLPHITFSKELTLHMGDITLELSFVGGHSAATVMIYVPEERVLFAGDNVEEGQLSYSGGGRFAPWIEMLRRVEEMDIDTIIPGHGNPCDQRQASRIRRYFEEMRDRVRPFVAVGSTKEEVAQKVDMTDSLPAPYGEEVARRMAFDIGLMYDQIKKGLI
jgi:cyclase